MLCWISKGIVNLTRDEGCDGIIHGVEFDTDSSNPKYFVQVLGHEHRVLHRKFYYLDQEQMLQDFATLKDCYVSLMVGSNNTGSRVRMYNPPQDLTNTIAQEERDISRRPSVRENLYASIARSSEALLEESVRNAPSFTIPSTSTFQVIYDLNQGSIIPRVDEDVYISNGNSSSSGDGT